MGAASDEPNVGAWPFRVPPGSQEPPAELDVMIVSHTHWDREWYNTSEWFKGRLVTTVDRVLDLLADDDGWSFVLDGQAIVVEDYLEARPGRADDLDRFVAVGRLRIGPWYVQPDSLLPSGEAHVRNLLEGRAVCGLHGGASSVAYTPDSFGHPAAFPTIFAGFGLRAFCYWRGHGDEIDELPARWTWCSADGIGVLAWHLHGSYLAAATLERTPDRAGTRLASLAGSLSERSPGRVILMNGFDHAVPDPHTADVVGALAATVPWTVHRGTLDDALDGFTEPLPASVWSGPLIGGRDANLLPGVWSARTPLKVSSRRAEAELWRAERACAVAAVTGLPDERPTVGRIRRLVVENQAHDSIGGCSTDRVHEQTATRSMVAVDAAESLTRRIVETIVGLGPDHLAPWSDEWDVAVWNPTAMIRSATIRIPIEGWPAFRVTHEGIERHPAHVATLSDDGFAVAGMPARLVPAADQTRDRFSPDHELLDLEVRVVDLPALGWRRLAITRAEPVADIVDDERTLQNGAASVTVDPDGSVTYTVGGRHWGGLLGIVDRGDRGDTYDADPLDDADRVRLRSVHVTRRRHPSGLGELTVRRIVGVPAALDSSRARRTDECVDAVLTTVLRLDPTGRLDVDIVFDGIACDHRLQIIGGPADGVEYATAFGQSVVDERATDPAASHPDWVHARPTTVCHQGWVAAGGLLVLAPGLHEAEPVTGGSVLITLLRAVGWMSRPDLRTRPGRASPAIPVPGAQCAQGIEARLAFLPDPADPTRRWQELEAFELQPMVVAAGSEPMRSPDRDTLAIQGALLSALKPAEDGAGVIARLWNPSRMSSAAEVRVAVQLSRVDLVRLDETSLGPVPFQASDGEAVIPVTLPPFAHRSLRLVTDRSMR